MAWQHANWTTITDLSERLTALNAHIAEVNARISTEKDSGDYRVSSYSLVRLVTDLLQQRTSLDQQLAITQAVGGSRTRVVFGGG